MVSARSGARAQRRIGPSSHPAARLSSSQRPSPRTAFRTPWVTPVGRCAFAVAGACWNDPPQGAPVSSLALRPQSTHLPNASAMVHLDDVVRIFGRGDGQLRALDGVTLTMARGTFTAIRGPSGSGKSTLLQIAAGLDRPTQGT